MTESTSGGTTGPHATSPGSRSVAGRPAAPSPYPAPAPTARTPRTLSVRLPLVTITFGPQPAVPAPPPRPTRPMASGGATLERLVFYGGVAAAGALGALEWPVAIAVATGTWVAQHTLPSSLRPAPRDGAGRAQHTPAADVVTGDVTGTPIPVPAPAGRS
jgi:hypothetical protein